MCGRKLAILARRTPTRRPGSQPSTASESCRASYVGEAKRDLPDLARRPSRQGYSSLSELAQPAPQAPRCSASPTSLKPRRYRPALARSRRPRASPAQKLLASRRKLPAGGLPARFGEVAASVRTPPRSRSSSTRRAKLPGEVIRRSRAPLPSEEASVRRVLIGAKVDSRSRACLLLRSGPALFRPRVCWRLDQDLNRRRIVASNSPQGGHDRPRPCVDLESRPERRRRLRAYARGAAASRVPAHSDPPESSAWPHLGEYRPRYRRSSDQRACAPPRLRMMSPAPPRADFS